MDCAHRVIRPLNAITGAMGALAEGDLDVTIPIDRTLSASGAFPKAFRRKLDNRRRRTAPYG
ncbi:HAMP domain-containing protein [Rhizobium leguminosarum]|uniref:HAMP domain-containing protein n=1 Tax=Rhizobium leguminosarum TaxID=384 RepID=UPI0014949F79